MIQQFNKFIFSVYKKLYHLPLENRKRIIKKVIKDVEKTEIFTPVEDLWEDEEDNILSPEEIIEVNNRKREKKILELQAFYKDITLEDDEDEPVDEEREYQIRKCCGNTEAHDAVESNDLDLLRHLIEEGKDMTQKNNTGYTPISLAFLQDKREVIELFREYGIVPKPIKKDKK